MYNFDKIIERRSHNSVKWNRFGQDVIPMWVADTDFEVSEAIQNAVDNYKNTLIYGYARPSDEIYNVIIDRFHELYNWKILKEWIVLHPSVVSSIFATCRMISMQPYSVMTSLPVYHPFIDAATYDDRTLVGPSLIHKDGKWTMDFEEMASLADDSTKLYILCNPHNPTGRMYSADELNQLVDFCVERNILLCSDEIHADIIMNKDLRHIPVASLSEKAAMNTVSLFSPGKAYNMPGINSGFAIIPNAVLREKFEKQIAFNMPHMNKMAGDAAMAAYKDSNDWLKASTEYLRKNHEYLYKEINSIPGLKMDRAEATYLAWIDFSGLPTDDFAGLLEEYGVGVQPVSDFGGNDKHIRLNFGTQFTVLQEVLKRIRRAVDSLDVK